MNNVNNDLEKMKPKVYEKNSVLCLTPESKIDLWIKKIKETIDAGNKVKFYSDIESTGFAFWKRGRAIYDKNIDEKKMRKDNISFFIRINSIINDEFDLPLHSLFCNEEDFDLKLSYFSCFYLNKDLFFGQEELIERINNCSNNDEKKTIMKEIKYLLENVQDDVKQKIKENINEQLKKLNEFSFQYLVKEAKQLSGKIDRMIEFAFVTCYENVDGEIFLLKDDDGDLIYFHEFIYPETKNIKEEQIINTHTMPIVPFAVHKTSFDFLKGEEVHPFLNIKLDKEAPNTSDVIRILLNFFDFKNEPKEKRLKYVENIEFFYHNGDNFDVPFIDAEIEKYYENVKLRDFVKIYDTLKIAKEIVPSDVQKFISACQSNPLFGGKTNIDRNKLIISTSKTVDNMKRLASFLIEFDLNRPKSIYEKSQKMFFESFKKYFETQKIDWQKFPNMVEYNNTKDINIDIKTGFPKSKDAEYIDLYNRYLKFLDGKKEYLKALNLIKKHKKIYSNLESIKENIKNNQFLQDALYRLNNTDRSAHGARVDSQLFMDAFIVIENALYLKPKTSRTKRHIELDDLKVDDETMNMLKNLINKD